MKQLKLESSARADLSNIRSYSIKRWGRDQANVYLREMNEKFSGIASGELRTNPVEYRGLRKYAFKSHVIYCLDDPDAVRIVRILHGRMDAKRHLK